MPTHEYACKDCGQHLEVVQKFSDDALTVCPNCQGNLRKVFSAPGISFKGSGFYKNDSRNTTKSSSTSSSSSSNESSSTSSEKSDSKPAESTSTAKPAETKAAPAKSSDSAS